MKFHLPKIYPITDVSLTGFSHLKQVKELIKGGATFIQLREKRAAPREFYEAAKDVLDYTRNSEIKIIINDRLDIALAACADGVHLGQDDLPPERARNILGENAIIGFSTHNIEQAIAASKLPLDYIAIGPIYETKSKENPDPIVGIEGLKTVRQAIGDFPLVAIGGINIEAAQTVWQNGADSIALISSLLTPSNIIAENTKSFLEKV
jgi:thiamine-phosphate pyrophosphorylase